MRLVALAVMVVCFCSIVSAQHKLSFTVVPQFGTSVSNLPTSTGNSLSRYKTGTIFGASFLLQRKDSRTALLMGTHYVQKGGRNHFETKTESETYIDNRTLKYNYADLSLQLRQIVWRNVYVRAGVIYSIGLNGNGHSDIFQVRSNHSIISNISGDYQIKFTPNGSHENSVGNTDFENRSDVSACGGIGVILKSLTIDLGYSRGLMRMIRKENFLLVNQVFQTTVGIPLLFRK